MNLLRKSSSWLLIVILIIPVGGYAQVDAVNKPLFSQAELDQLLAPIALYPDTLLAQILIAATYPLEIVSAARWVKNYPNLTGDRLAQELEKKDWDPSVKSLINFPSVLTMMNEKIEWTQKLGDAFLAQEEQVMETVQQLRKRAQEEGYLETTRQQTVTEQDDTIIIEPATPEVIYVPVYNPFIVYGPWWYLAYPPYYYYPPGYVVDSSIYFLSFGLHSAWGYAWGIFDWPHRHCYINVYRHTRINSHIKRRVFVQKYNLGQSGYGKWKHDSRHRKGVIYRGRITREKFGPKPRPGIEKRQEFRGRVPDEIKLEQRTFERPIRSRYEDLEREKRRVSNRERGVLSTPSDRRGIIIRREVQAPLPSPGGQIRREGVLIQPERPRNVFDRIERSGRDADSNSRRGRHSRQELFVPRKSNPDKIIPWSNPGGGRRDGGIRRHGGRR